MHCEKINFEEIGVFSNLFLDYIHQGQSLSSFIHLPPRIESNYPITSSVVSNIESLKNEKTYTITTGHQLNIFTGPLYFIYKILTVINTCEILKTQYPDHHFVPVFWMASEDHDLEEIRSFSLFGKKYTWDTNQKGPVGRMDPSSIDTILDELPERVNLFENAYLTHDTLSMAVRHYVNELFGTYGLVVMDADDVQLKGQFKHIIKDDLLDHHANDLVESASSRLAEKGYKAQVYPRAINLFYMKDNMRKRLVKERGSYKVIDTNLKFTENEILQEVDSYPERFSPNVILRPLLQEIILPNIAYIGGPAEIAYWLQLKDMFDHFKIPFPILLPRNFTMIINKGLNKKLQKLMIPSGDIFKPLDELKGDYIQEHTEFSIDLKSEVKIMHELFESVRNKSKAVDQSLEGFVQSEKVKVMKSLENIEKRLKKSEEQKQSVELNQIESLKEKLFPGGNLQERTDNYLNFALNNSTFLENIKKLLDPFDLRFHILTDD
jgi:bacillithiol biosynthesis cysteine-adding enzyme BshC